MRKGEYVADTVMEPSGRIICVGARLLPGAVRQGNVLGKGSYIHRGLTGQWLCWGTGGEEVR